MRAHDLYYEKGMTMNKIINGIFCLIMKNNDERWTNNVNII